MSTNIITFDTAYTVDMWNNKEKLDEIRKMISQYPLTDMEFSMLVELGKATKLNPFQREIWAVKYSEKDPAKIFIGRDGYRKAAQRQSDYEYHIADSVYSNDKFTIANNEINHTSGFADRGELVGAYCIVKRKSSERYTYNRVTMAEYNLNQSLWKSKPETMIKKVAEAQALRQSFQEIFAGTYHDAEVPESMHSKRKPITIIQPSEPTQTNKLVQLLKNKQGGNRLHTIQSLLREVNLSPERYDNALAYYKVTTIEDLTCEQQESFIKNLEKVRLRHNHKVAS